MRGGRTYAVAGNASQPDTFYMGSVGGGVWKTENSGRTWFPISDEGIPIGSIGAIAVAPSDPNVVYVGTGEPDIRSQHSYGIGVFKSTDAGKTWTHIGLENTRQIGRIVVDPADPNRVYVAALGHVYRPIPTAASFAPPTAARTGQRCWPAKSIPTTWAQSTRARPHQRQGALRIALGHAPSAVVGLRAVQHAGKRTLQIHRRRRQLETVDRRPAHRRFVGKIGIAVAPSNPNRLWAVVDDIGQQRRQTHRFGGPSATAGKRHREASISPTTPAQPGAGQRRNAPLGARLVLRIGDGRPRPIPTAPT
jgi:hypothetical protein